MKYLTLAVALSAVLGPAAVAARGVELQDFSQTGSEPSGFVLSAPAHQTEAPKSRDKRNPALATEFAAMGAESEEDPELASPLPLQAIRIPAWTIADFRKSDRFEMDNFTDALLRSLKRNGTDYSDLLIRGPDTQTVCRLVLDPFSATLYSSSPAVYAVARTKCLCVYVGRFHLCQNAQGSAVDSPRGLQAGS